MLGANLLNSHYSFIPNSKLQEYIKSKIPNAKAVNTLSEILIILKDIIRDEGMFDEKNPSIILCSEHLENALGMKALHVSEIRALVLKHLVLQQLNLVLHVLPKPTGHCNLDSQQLLLQQLNLVLYTPPNVAIPHVQESSTRVLRSAPTKNIHKTIYNDNTKVTLKPDFKKTLCQLKHFPKNKRHFTYKEICNYTSEYILLKKNQIIDPRNIKVALVKNDALGKAFGVNSFHRCQVTSLIHKQLIPVRC